MSPLSVAVTLLALVAFATALGLFWRWQNGRTRVTDGRDIVSTAEIGAPLGRAATLLQFSSAVCAPCRSTRTVLASVAATSDDIAHVDVDVAAHDTLTRRFNILQTPTTLILDADGVVRARIGGAARRADVYAHLALIAS